MPRSPEIAIVVDALPAFRGGERGLAAVLELFPEAPIYTLIYEPSAFVNTVIANKEVRTSWIQCVPGGKLHYRSFLPLLPMTVEQFDLRHYDIVLSFSSAVAHGVLCRPGQLHISYTWRPLRYAWQDTHEYFRQGPLAPLYNVILHYLRLWDVAAAARVDHFVAPSRWAASCIWRAYRRECEVIYPPVETERFRPLSPRGDYYAVVSWLVRWKKLDIIVEAFSRMGLPLTIIGAGPERKKLQALASPNVKVLEPPSLESIAQLLGKARALVHAAEEDFGLVLAEAQAAGCPVIAYLGGAAPEIIVDGKTGVLFSHQSPESLMEAVRRFEREAKSFRIADSVRSARRFSKERFKAQFAQMVEREWSSFLRRARRR